jgi:hypothetical protein
MRRALAALGAVWVGIVAGQTVAVAQPVPVPANADGHCLPADLTDTLGLARIGKAPGRVHFVRGVHESKECPTSSAACRSRGFLVAGDVVLTSERRGEFVCATFVNARAQETSGWLPAAALENMPVVAAAVPQGWAGTWRRIEAEITIKPALHGELTIDGTATWGGSDPARVARGAVRTGDLSGKARPVDGTLLLSDEPVASFEKAPESICAARMRRVGPYLLVEDNKACGGMNVTFSGVYVRR